MPFIVMLFSAVVYFIRKFGFKLLAFAGLVPFVNLFVSKLLDVMTSSASLDLGETTIDLLGFLHYSGVVTCISTIVSAWVWRAGFIATKKVFT